MNLKNADIYLLELILISYQLYINDIFVKIFNIGSHQFTDISKNRYILILKKNSTYNNSKFETIIFILAYRVI